jgi:hypothetical protein
LVILRNGERVWEGPIIRVAFSTDGIEIEARDVLWYAFRRVMARKLNYKYPNLAKVLDVAKLVLRDVYAQAGDPYGYNAIISTVYSTDDSRTAAEFAAYSRTVGELVDTLAEDFGMDYTVAGRRILLWDTHARCHVLPRLTDEAFLNSPVITEYGSSLYTRSYVTNNDGKVRWVTAPQRWLDYYGPIDYVQSDVQTADGNPEAPEDEETMEESAARNLDGHYPSPVLVRLPENTPLDPSYPVAINDLIPGAWAPLYSNSTCRTVEQWQKLDSMEAVIEEGIETVTVTFVSAPQRVAEPV